MKKALITGITGQDGSYLAEFLLKRDYEVHGIIRRASTFNTSRIDHLYIDPHLNNVRLFLHYGDLSDSVQLLDLVYSIRPDEIYHLAAQSHVRVSFEMPEYTADITGIGVVRLLEAIRRSKVNTHFIQASSSEMFGNSPAPHSEITPFYPRSPYAAAKAYGYWMTVNYREGYNLRTSNAIMFNHESPRRGETFVTRKITRAVCAIAKGLQQKLFLGNLKAQRDWGFAPEYVAALWQMAQRESSDDYVLGTGEMHSVEEFVSEAFSYLNLDWKDYVHIDPKYFRPSEADCLKADSSKAKRQLDWDPKVRFKDLVKIMVDADAIHYGVKTPGEGLQFLTKNKFDWFKF